MSAIMIDGMSIEGVIMHLGGEFELYHDDYESYFENRGERYSSEICWDNFLTAIVLWDEIWNFKPNDYRWKDIFVQSNIVDNMKKLVRTVSREAIDEPFLDTYLSLVRGNSHTPPNIRRRTLGYQLISNSLGVPFLAHPRRATYLLDDLSRSIPYHSKADFNRLDIISRIDKELMTYYERINKELGRDMLKIKYPVLIDYIIRQTNTPEEEMEAALSLRNERYVVDFRKELNNIENLINECGDIPKILSELTTVSDLAKDITSKYSKETKLGELSISLAPSFSTPIILKKRKKGLHITFIRKLMNYGINERFA